MEAILTSIAVVAIAEIGDKTQLLAIVLAARFRKPLPIIFGIFTATLLNHAAAAGVGYLVARWLAVQDLRTDVAPLRCLPALCPTEARGAARRRLSHQARGFCVRRLVRRWAGSPWPLPGQPWSAR